MPKIHAFLLVPLALFLGGAAAVGESRASDPRTTLRLLHDGRFDEAAESLRPDGSSPDPAAREAFLAAFVDYWRLLYDDENRALSGRFEEKLVRAAELGEAASAAGGVPWDGYARLLLAQLRASQKKPVLAAREARAGKRRLEEALRADPSSPEPLFGLGTYNYYADRMSALVKGLRFLLGLPGGDRELGLDQLETSARQSTYFALESRILLATIYGSRQEKLYTDAVRQAEKALSAEPDAVTLLDAAGRLYLSLGRPEVAATMLERAIARVREAPRTDPSVAGALAYQRARAEFAMFRPDLALARLDAMALRTTAPARLRRDIAALRAASSQLDVSPEILAASLAELESLAAKTPDRPVLELLLGRAYLRSGRVSEALTWLARADSRGTLPGPWIGPCRLLAGRAADLLGQRTRAIDFYRKAQKAPPFMEMDATRFHQQVPYRDPTTREPAVSGGGTSARSPRD